MKTITVPVFIHSKRAESWEKASHGEWSFAAYPFAASEITCSRTDVLATTVTFDIPDDWSPVPQEIAVLEAKRATVLADAQMQVNTINDTISKLQALTYEVA